MSPDLQRFFERLPGAFRPEKASKWTASIYFYVPGHAGWTLEVDSGACTLAEGRQGQPAVEVSGSPETWEKIARGQDTLKNAFVRGDVITNHSAALLRLERAFDLGEAEHGAGAPAALRPELVGHVIPGEPVRIDAAAIRAFAEATGDPNPAYVRADAPIAPVVFPIRLVRSIFVHLLTEEETGGDVTRMVHAEQDIRVRRPLVAGDLAIPTAVVSRVEEVSYGDSLSIEQRIEVAGEVSVEVTTVLFFKDPSGQRRSVRHLHSRPHVTGRNRATTFEASTVVAPDQPIAYAEASGDSNPLHTDREFARSLGFRDVLLQGTCTMAIAGRAVVDHACAGDPERLRRLRVRFARPVFPGDTLRTAGWKEKDEAGGAVYGFETANQEGKRVLINGIALVAPA